MAWGGGWGNRGWRTNSSNNSSSSSRNRPRRRATSSSNSGYNPVTSAGISTNRQVNQTNPYVQYWGRSAPTRQITTPSGRTLNQMGQFPGSTQDYLGFRAGLAAGNTMAPTGPSFLGGGGGGGRGYGGGGGGGGGAAMTQAMLDQMLAALGTRGPQLDLQTVDLPTFRGQALQAFNPAQYELAQRQLNQASAADKAAIAAQQAQTAGALKGNYSNAYANTEVAQAPVMAQVGAALQGTAGGGGGNEAAEVNAAAGNDQAGFANLLKVLAAADQTSQNSRMNQVALDAGTARNQLAAQVRGLGAGIGQARAGAYNQWQQANNERNYQNSLMQQQWNREEMTRNQDITNQMRQGNWQQTNEMIQNRMTPLLELIGSTAGAKLDLEGIKKILKLWQGT